MSHPSFTGIRELDQEILLELDDTSLDRACYVDKWTQSICTDPLFWRERILRKYGSEILQHKPLGETYYQQYQRLRRIHHNPEKYPVSIKEHHLDEMVALRQEGVRPNASIMHYAARYGDPEILDWFFAQGFNPFGILHAIFLGDSPENLEWYYQHARHFNQGDPDDAVRHRAIKILNYLFEKYNALPHPTQITLNNLAITGDLDTLIWLDQHNLGLPDQRAANLVRDIIDYIVNEGPLSPAVSVILNSSVLLRLLIPSIMDRFPERRPEDLIWDVVKRYLTQEEIDQVKRRYEDVLDWMISRGLH